MRYLSVLVLALTASFTAPDARAQNQLELSAGRKITGSVYRPLTARTYQRQAINHAQVLNYYGRSNSTVPTETAQEHAVEVRRNLTSSQKEISKLKTELKDDAEAQKLIAQIEDHNKKAVEHCGMLDAECAKQAPQGTAVSSCCADMLKELQAADAAHEQLLKHLKISVHAEHSKK